MRLFDRTTLKLRPLSERRHDMDLSSIMHLDKDGKFTVDKKLGIVSERIINAREKQSSIVLMMGGHLIKSGVQNYLIDLMKKGYISCIAMNGAGMIHDFELALIGATTESVAHYIKEGQFGLWQETARLNDIINEAYKKDPAIGMGRAIGQYIEKNNLPHKSISILATACALDIPVTVHVGIGYDIIHEYPNCEGAATGALSYNDFLRFVSVIQNLEHGVVMNFGSSIMAPEVFLKALSMARNVARQEKKKITHFTSLVCDLLELPSDITKEPPKHDPAYYFRPLKTMLVRTLADGGEGFYVRGNHRETIPGLWTSLNQSEVKSGKTH